MTPMEARPPDAEPRPVILDVDTGIDDMVALLIAATAPELNLRGVTCVAGNVEIHHVARNTGKILRMVGRGDVPVSIGAARPLHRRLRTAPDTHGPTGTGYVELTGEDPALGSTDYTAVPAPRYLGAHLSAIPGELTMVALGPLTNVAAAALNGVDLARRPARVDLDGRRARGARQHHRDRRVERVRRPGGGRGLPGGRRDVPHLPAGRHPGRGLHAGGPGGACRAPRWPAWCATRSASTSPSTARRTGSTAATCTTR